MQPMSNKIITAHEENTGLRLDRFLAAECSDLSRSRLISLIKQGHVSIKGHKILQPDYRVKPDEVFTIEIPEAAPAEPEPEAIPLDILYEDDALVVIDKPAGLVVHPAAGNWSGTLVNALIAHCGDSLSGIGGIRRPGIVHRLDKDTTGVMVVAKTDAAHQGLSAQFADHGREGPLTREYRALVWGKPRPLKGTIETHIGRHPTHRLKMAVARNDGKHAVTTYQVVRSFPEGGKNKAEAVASLLECHLKTGRTHQIRVHLSHIGHPIIGDDLYGSGFRSKTRTLQEDARSAIMRLTRQALHAAVLGFVHPISQTFMRFESDLPHDMREVVEALK
jgi:23S rRNA pseudouridine1911/1915/1917 synthase